MHSLTSVTFMSADDCDDVVFACDFVDGFYVWDFLDFFGYFLGWVGWVCGK